MRQAVDPFSFLSVKWGLTFHQVGYYMSALTISSFFYLSLESSQAFVWTSCELHASCVHEPRHLVSFKLLYSFPGTVSSVKQFLADQHTSEIWAARFGEDDCVVVDSDTADL